MDYLDCLSEILVADILSRPKDELVPSEYIGYARALIGQLLWVAVRISPLIAYSVAEVSSKLSSLTVSEVLILNKVVRQLRSQSGCRLRSGNLTGHFANWKFVCLEDASVGNNADGTTQAVYLVFLVNFSSRDSFPPTLISWRSHKLKRVARSTLCVETLAATEAIDAALSIQKTTESISQRRLSIICLSDSKSLVVAAVSNSKISQKNCGWK